MSQIDFEQMGHVYLQGFNQAQGRKEEEGNRAEKGVVFVRGDGGCSRRRCGAWVAATTGKELWVSLAKEGRRGSGAGMRVGQWGEEKSEALDFT
ncbi:hypothetical protein Droror1_Dr00018505 [Drosera rotundifolia]